MKSGGHCKTIWSHFTTSTSACGLVTYVILAPLCLFAKPHDKKGGIKHIFMSPEISELGGRGCCGCAQLLISVSACPGHKCAYSKEGLATQRHQSLLISASWCPLHTLRSAVPGRHPVEKCYNCFMFYKKEVIGIKTPARSKILSFLPPIKEYI